MRRWRERRGLTTPTEISTSHQKEQQIIVLPVRSATKIGGETCVCLLLAVCGFTYFYIAFFSRNMQCKMQRCELRCDGCCHLTSLGREVCGVGVGSPARIHSDTWYGDLQNGP